MAIAGLAFNATIVGYPPLTLDGTIYEAAVADTATPGTISLLLDITDGAGAYFVTNTAIIHNDPYVTQFMDALTSPNTDANGYNNYLKAQIIDQQINNTSGVYPLTPSGLEAATYQMEFIWSAGIQGWSGYSLTYNDALSLTGEIPGAFFSDGQARTWDGSGIQSITFLPTAGSNPLGGSPDAGIIHPALAFFTEFLSSDQVGGRRGGASRRQPRDPDPDPWWINGWVLPPHKVKPKEERQDEPLPHEQVLAEAKRKLAVVRKYRAASQSELRSLTSQLGGLSRSAAALERKIETAERASDVSEQYRILERKVVAYARELEYLGQKHLKRLRADDDRLIRAILELE